MSGAGNRRPLVSVIVATNRGRPFLDEALDSVAAQTYPHVELIVVDDGSPESAGVQEATDRIPGARYIRQEPAGVSTARNLGAFRAHGDYLVFLDDDDRWAPSRLAHQLSALEARPDSPVCYCRVRSIDQDGTEIAPGDQVAVASASDVIRARTGILLPNIMIRAEAFARVGGFHSRMSYGEDRDLVLRLALEGPFVFVPRVLVDYRAHPANTSRRHHRLAEWMRRILLVHRARARDDGDTALVRDYDEALRATSRYAAWSSAREIRNTRSARVVADELAWLVSFAPLAPIHWLRKRMETRIRR